MKICEMLGRNARIHPEEVALVERISDEGIRKVISWREFDEKVNRLANALMQSCIKDGIWSISLFRGKTLSA